jgi:hypothetical protein
MIPSQALGSDIVHESQGGHFLKYVDQPYEMQGLHHEGLAWSKDEPSLSYCSPIQRWIEQACGCTCQSWHDFVALAHPHELDSMFGHDVMFVPAHDHLYLIYPCFGS